MAEVILMSDLFIIDEEFLEELDSTEIAEFFFSLDSDDLFYNDCKLEIVKRNTTTSGQIYDDQNRPD